ncbi:hypothetical protein COCNU_11G007340 [Cocos nucifera]|uniref:Uncharacterized protein n=1 Tax=Cocos nucifera TaxID=13894 RepID=A0A8K0N9L7_COCNU|nr:hypothetical protein COCNU_11G007340 [Cocos nucifera]
MAQLDAAARGTYVLNNDLDTIERLVARLHETVESDKKLVRLGLERGRGQHHPIEEVVRQLRKNHPSFLHQLRTSTSTSASSSPLSTMHGLCSSNRSISKIY